MPESCVPSEVPGKDVSCGGKFLANEAEAQKPCPHCVFGIFVLLWPGACRTQCFCHLGKGKAKLDVAFQLSGMQSVLFAARRRVKLEKPELNRPLGKGYMEV